MIAVVVALALLCAVLAWGWHTAAHQTARYRIQARHHRTSAARLRRELDQTAAELQRGWDARNRQTSTGDMESDALREIDLMTSPPTHPEEGQ